jgi:hypothetical protein
VVTTKFFDKFGGLMFMDCYFHINMSLETIHLGWKGLCLLWWFDVQGWPPFQKHVIENHIFGLQLVFWIAMVTWCSMIATSTKTCHWKPYISHDRILWLLWSTLYVFWLGDYICLLLYNIVLLKIVEIAFLCSLASKSHISFSMKKNITT